LNDSNFLLCYRFLNYWLLNDVLSYNSFLLYHRNLFCNNERNLNFYCFNFSLENLDFLILDSISVSRNSNFSNYLIGNSSLYFNFNWLLSFNYSLNYPLNLYNFDHFLYLYNDFFNWYFDDLLYFLYNHKWHWNLNNL
jgi:hypothetical protein